MANIISYKTSAVKSSDLILGTLIPDPNTNKNPRTVNFSVSDVIALAPFTSLTTTGASGDAATLVSGVLNIPTPVIPFTGLTTNGTSGASTLAGGVLNVPNYTTGIQSVVAGTNVTVDNNDPANPIINATGGMVGSGTIGSLPIWTGTSELGDSFLQKGSTVDSLQTSNATASGTSSIAFGQDAQAISSSSVAIGTNSLADTGTSPIALGYQAKARNDSTVSIGFQSESNGRFATAIGSRSQAYGLSSTAIGGGRAEVGADYSLAIGTGSNTPIVSGVGSIIIGTGGEASGINSMIFGLFSFAQGAQSKVIAGNQAYATGDYTVCSGLYTEAHDYGETVFGYYNKISTGSQTSPGFINDNNIFVVGNGSSTGNRSNALELSQRGKLTLPYYPTIFTDQNPRRALGVESINGEVIAVDGPYWETPKSVSVTAGGTNSDLDANSLGLIKIFWGSQTLGGVFTLNLPDSATVTYRTFKFLLVGFGRGDQQDVILQPFTGQTINGAPDYYIPNGNFNVVEIWCNGFNTSPTDWIITSKLIN
jgi:hypothetical protein